MLKDYIKEFAKYQQLGSHTLAQLSDGSLNFVPAAQANSIAMIVRHLHGNLISRFTDILTEDGEKDWRDRVAEFAEMTYTRAEVEAYWTAAWAKLEMALTELSEDDLSKSVIIKGKAMTADAAICRALAHVAYHVGQIVLLGRMAKADDWAYLSTPREP